MIVAGVRHHPRKGLQCSQSVSTHRVHRAVHAWDGVFLDPQEHYCRDGPSEKVTAGRTARTEHAGPVEQAGDRLAPGTRVFCLRQFAPQRHQLVVDALPQLVRSRHSPWHSAGLGVRGRWSSCLLFPRGEVRHRYFVFPAVKLTPPIQAARATTTTATTVPTSRLPPLRAQAGVNNTRPAV
jgi:hypothetical protein